MDSDHDILIRMDEKMTGIRDRFIEHVQAEEVRHVRHETRLTALEQWRWKWVGAIAVLMFLFNLFSDRVKHIFMGS